jgi:hypothetical protein
MTRKVRYARVSTEGQNLGRQLAALHQEGCDPIFQDKASGKSVRGRPGLDKAIKALRPGGVSFGISRIFSPLPRLASASKACTAGGNFQDMVGATNALMEMNVNVSWVNFVTV